MKKTAVSILERPVYGVSEAAALLGLRTDRARAWLDGYARRGADYAPVIRVEPTGDDTVTWGEFVELGYLREYRRKGVPLQRLRPVIDELRRRFATPYPLATAKPYVLGKELVLELQERNSIPPAIAIVIRSGQQVLLVITRDKRIRYRPVERRMWVVHRVRGFVLTGKTSQSTADSLALIESHWAKIENIVASAPDGPWMYAVTAAGLRPIPLD